MSIKEFWQLLNEWRINRYLRRMPIQNNISTLNFHKDPFCRVNEEVITDLYSVLEWVLKYEPGIHKDDIESSLNITRGEKSDFNIYRIGQKHFYFIDYGYLDVGLEIPEEYQRQYKSKETGKVINVNFNNQLPVKILTGMSVKILTGSFSDYEKYWEDKSIMEAGKINKDLRIKIIHGKRKGTYRVKKTPFYIGSGYARNILNIPGNSIRTHHCKIIFYNGNYILENLDLEEIYIDGVSLTSKRRIMIKPGNKELFINGTKLLLILEENYYWDSSDQHFESEDYTKIGGWLILVAIGLTITPLILIVTIVKDIIPSFSYLNGYNQYNINTSTLKVVLAYTLVVAVIIILYYIILNVLFYMRKKIFPLLMIILLAAAVVFSLIDYLLVLRVIREYSPTMIYGIPNSLKTESLIEFIKTIIIAGVWIPYFILSKRVKKTFVN